MQIEIGGIYSLVNIRYPTRVRVKKVERIRGNLLAMCEIIEPQQNDPRVLPIDPHFLARPASNLLKDKFNV